MGLMDILNGMQNGPRGQRDAAPGGGGMSPWMMALLGLLAYKAMKGGGLGNMLGGGQGQAPYQQPPNQTGGGLGDVLGGMLGRGSSPRGGGGLGDILGGALAGGAASGGLGGLLGGLLGGGAGGNVLNGGLRNLVQDMQQNGHGDEVQSWVGRGENRAIDPNDLAHAVGIDDIDAVAQQTGMPREQILSELSQHLPEFVDQLTPDGRLPTEQEASRWV
ncbi:MAG TPA: YidB family protein [Xanthobacteraceae bacterium]|nr:YidB family protein [Xanthobacteraceae bacterium]